MATIKSLSKKREKFIEESEIEFLLNLQKYQVGLGSVIQNELNDLDRDGKQIIYNAANIRKIAALNKKYSKYAAKNGMKIVSPLIENLEGLHDLNKTYFEMVAGKNIDKLADKTKERSFLSYGFDITTNKLIIGGLLHSILYDESPINRIKGFLLNSIKGSTPFSKLINPLIDIIKGRGDKPGSIVKHFEERLPQPFQRFDRATGTILATDLQLNHAIYQGGLIRDSRPFCIERNDKVFTRQEIEKFGTPQDQYDGYSNKSQGHFAGKTPIYDPFTDIGGYNCRHQLDWISDELAKTLRPDLD